LVCCLVAAVATRSVPYDTQGRDLAVTNEKLLEDAEMQDPFKDESIQGAFVQMDD